MVDPTLPVVAASQGNEVSDVIALGTLGLVPVQFTKAEEKILDRPVVEKDVRIKPTGQVYLPHYCYTKWLNDAFGRGQWAIVPRSKPQLQQDGKRNQVVVAYMLHVHGQAVAFSVGEQEYWDKNAEQSYGDALEATVASGLRRAAKRLGIGLELWDREWCDAWAAKYAVAVETVDGEGRKKTRWRKKDAAPLPGETRVIDGASAAPREGGSRTAPDGFDRTGDRPISDAQAKRLWTIARRVGRADTEVKMWLKVQYGIDSSRAIKRKDYEAICEAIEASGPLPLPNDREPGQEG